jgi:hypothetical protein
MMSYVRLRVGDNINHHNHFGEYFESDDTVVSTAKKGLHCNHFGMLKATFIP